MEFMKPCIVCFSRTGNTKRLAQAIGGAVKAPIFDMAITQPSVLAEFDVFIMGNPVEGASPAKEASAFVENMPTAEGKKSFCFALTAPSETSEQ